MSSDAAPDISSGPERDLLKVVFTLDVDDDGWPPYGHESVWVAKTGVPLHATVESVPFFIRDLAFRDEISVRPDYDRRELFFERVVRRSGHSTVRVMSMNDTVGPTIKRELESAGCSWEGFRGSLLAVDIPAETTIGRYGRSFSFIMPRMR